MVLRDCARAIQFLRSRAKEYHLDKTRVASMGDAVERFSTPSQWPAFYGLKAMDELNGPEGMRIRADVDMLGLITKDDPPIFLTANSQMEKLVSLGAVYHTPQHSREIKKRCDGGRARGIEDRRR